MSAWLEYVVEDEYLQGIANKLNYDSNLHITIAFFGRGLSKIQTDAIAGCVNQWVRSFPKKFEIYGTVALSHFNGKLKVQEVIVPQRIHDIRQILLTQLYLERVKWHNDYDWNPHITLGEDRYVGRENSGFSKSIVKKIWFHNDYEKYDIWTLE